MGLFGRLLQSKSSSTNNETSLSSGSPSSPLRYIPSFNDFLGDMPAPEAEAEAASYDRVKTEQLVAASPPPSRNLKPVNPDVWRSVFDPGSNINIHRVGKQYYDVVVDPKCAPTTWDYIIQAENNKASFAELDRGDKGFIVESDLKAAFDNKYDTKSLMDQADANKDGQISRDEYEHTLDTSA